MLCYAVRAIDAAKLGEAYAFSGTALELGAVVLDGAPHPEAPVRIPLSMLNRHGLVAGATGTGKTKTLQLIAEQLSAAGVPFRNEVLDGPGGRQVLVEDPCGNPVELFQPAGG